MPEETGRRLAEYATEHVGGALRAVVVIYQDSIEIIYLSDKLATSYSREAFTRIADSFRDQLGDHRNTSQDSPLGSKHCFIHHYENAFIFQFPHEDCHSILMSVEPQVGSNLDRFVRECKHYL